MNNDHYTYDNNRLMTREGHLVGFFDNYRIYDASHCLVGMIKVPWVVSREGRPIGKIDGLIVKNHIDQKIGTLKEIWDLIDGPRNIVLVAFWLLILKDK